MTLLTIDCYVRPNRQVSIVDIPTYCDVNLLLLDPSSCVKFVISMGIRDWEIEVPGAKIYRGLVDISFSDSFSPVHG